MMGSNSEQHALIVNGEINISDAPTGLSVSIELLVCSAVVE